ncbi:MAG: hypothetical protein GY851_05725, partial [bacterium]|nr:hypothetical protein [bacterium]
MKTMRWLALALCVSTVAGNGSSAADGEVSFDPKASVSACVLWLDATDRDADGQVDDAADGASVGTWHDKSGLGHNAVQTVDGITPVVAERAMGDKAAIRFDGNDSLTDSLTRHWSRVDWSVVVVASLDADAKKGWRGIVGNRFGKGAGHWWTLGTKSDGTNYLELCAGGGVSSTLEAGDSGAHIYTVVKRESSFRLYRDGVLVGTAVKDSVGGLDNELHIGRWYGNTQGWQGTIAEVLVYDRAMVDAERSRIEAYLSEKWSAPVMPNLYTKQATWAETMIASREAYAGFRGTVETNPAAATAIVALKQYLWQRMTVDYPGESGLFVEELPDGEHLAWFEVSDGVALERSVIEGAGAAFKEQAAALGNAPASDPRWLEAFVKAAETRRRFRGEAAWLKGMDLVALRRAVEHLSKNYPDSYSEGTRFLEGLTAWEGRLPAITKALEDCDDGAIGDVSRLAAFQREALLANPLLDFPELLMVRRSQKSVSLGLPQNWQSNCVLPRSGFDNEIAKLSLADLDGPADAVYRPEGPSFVGDVDLHYDGKRMLFSAIGAHGRWQIFEVGADGSGLRQVTPGDEPDVDNYDACYLADDDIMFCSSAYFAAVPCVNGSTRTANLYRMKPDGSGARQLCFDQEHNWCPTMLPNGRVLYLRWEYTDTPHSHDRVLFHMDPDGMGQMEYYGSNS